MKRKIEKLTISQREKIIFWMTRSIEKTYLPELPIIRYSNVFTCFKIGLLKEMTVKEVRVREKRIVPV